MEGIEKLAKIIEFIKKKKKTNAQVEYQRYSKMPKDKAKQYIDDLEKRILKGGVDVGNISDEELEIFNQKPSQEDIIKAKNEKKRNMMIGVISFIVFLVIFIASGAGESDSKASQPLDKPSKSYTCDMDGARDFAIGMVEASGKLHYLDFSQMVGNDWLFVGYYTTYERNISAYIDYRVGCDSEKSYYPVDVDVRIDY